MSVNDAVNISKNIAHSKMRSFQVIFFLILHGSLISTSALSFAGLEYAHEEPLYQPRVHQLARYAGSISILSLESELVAVRNLAYSNGNPQPDLGFQMMVPTDSRTWMIPVGFTDIMSWCQVINSTGKYEQTVWTWSTRVDENPCGGNCRWTVNDAGFWFRDSSEKQYFVQGWNKICANPQCQ